MLFTLACARQDALSALSSASNTGPPTSSHSPAASTLFKPPTLGYGQLPNSESQSTLRQVDIPSFDHFIATKSHSLKPPHGQHQVQLGLAPSLFRDDHPSEHDEFQNGSGAYEDGRDDDVCGAELDWQASHYRRMHRERQQMLEERKKKREARKQAASHVAHVTLSSLRAQQQQQQQQQQRQQHQRVGLHRPQPSTSSIGSSTDYSLSRSNTGSSSASSSSSRFVSTHPSRSRTPDLLASRPGHHSRNESLGSSISSLSSSLHSHSHSHSNNWGFGASRGAGTTGWDSGAGLAIREEGDSMDEDGEESVERIEAIAPLQSALDGVREKGKERMSKAHKAGEMRQDGMKMSDVLNSILEMEKGFFTSPPRTASTLPSSTARGPCMSTPPKKPTRPSQAQGISTPQPDEEGPRTPQVKPSIKANKRCFAPSPPSPPRAPTAPFRLSHRQTASETSFKKHDHRQPLDIRKASLDDVDLESFSTAIGRSGSPLPPPAAESRPRTLVYSPTSAPSNLNRYSTKADCQAPPLAFTGNGQAGTFSFPTQQAHLPHPHHHTPSYSSSQPASSYGSEPEQRASPSNLLLLLSSSPNPSASSPNPSYLSIVPRSSVFSNRYPQLDGDHRGPALPLAPPLFPSSPTPGTPEFERMMEESRRGRFIEEEGVRGKEGGWADDEDAMAMEFDGAEEIATRAMAEQDERKQAFSIPPSAPSSWFSRLY